MWRYFGRAASKTLKSLGLVRAGGRCDSKRGMRNKWVLLGLLDRL